MAMNPSSISPGSSAALGMGSGNQESSLRPADTFTHKFIPAFGKRVHRLGLATNYGIDESGVRVAFERGLNYVFATPMAKDLLITPLLQEIKRNRDGLVLASGPTLGYFGGSVRRGAERALRRLQTDYLDVYQLFWLGTTSAWTESTIAELVKLRESGKARAIAVSIHDRVRAGKLAADSPLDALMIRYNAAHPGAERDIFPHCDKRDPVIIAYTATDWRKLLSRPAGWTGPVPTAGDCYRFCLSNPYVDVVLCGPGNQQQLEENLKALEKGPLSDEEMKWMRDFGKIIYGKGVVTQK